MMTKNRTLIACVFAALIAAGTTMSARAADETDVKDARTSLREFREKVKDLTPEERRAAIRKWREEHPDAAAVLKETRTRREGLKHLTPEQRKARIEERRTAIEKRIAELKKKQDKGAITDREKQRLGRMERVLSDADRARDEKPSGGAKPAEK